MKSRLPPMTLLKLMIRKAHTHMMRTTNHLKLIKTWDLWFAQLKTFSKS